MKWIARDYWFTIDKLYHFVGLILATIFIGYQEALAFGLGKELMDIPRSGFSYKDLIAGYLGIALVTIIKYIMVVI